jgi:hypothetical protein
MKTNIYAVTADNGGSYDDLRTETVVVEAPTIEEAVVKGAKLLANDGFHYNTVAKLGFENVIMKKPKTPKAVCKHCGKADPV